MQEQGDPTSNKTKNKNTGKKLKKKKKEKPDYLNERSNSNNMKM